MTIRNWFKFFFTALLIGGFVTAVAGLIVRSGILFGSTHLLRRDLAVYAVRYLWMVFLRSHNECCSADGFLCLFNNPSIRCEYF